MHLRDMVYRGKGCKGDRTPMYRALAPFPETVRGDRRVTGTAQGERGRLGGIRERLQKKEKAFLLKEI